MISLKTCKGCKEEKSLSDFHKHPLTRDGRHTECKICASARQRIRYQNNKQAIREYVRNYRNKNRESVNANLRRYYKENHEILKAKKKVRYNENPEKFRAQTRAIKLKSNYGLTVDQYDAMVIVQHGKCAICGAPPTVRKKNLTVDHSHKTGKVRELLCQNCNSGLGHFKDDPGLLILATNYLRKHK